MTANLSGKKIAFLVANEGIEQVELTEPWQAVQQAGAEPVLIAPEGGQVQAFHHLDKGDTFPVDVPLSASPGTPGSGVSVDDYAALVLPGGVANPDHLRTVDAAVQFVREFARSGKPIAAICHGPWTLINADAVAGRTLTSWPSLQTDLRNAGATWVDEEVHVDTNGPGPLITSRKPDDLKAFDNALLDALG